MRLLKRPPVLGCVKAMAAATLLMAGCKDGVSPTEPIRIGNISGAWTGTNNGISDHCDSSAKASFQQTLSGNSSDLSGTATFGCYQPPLTLYFWGDFSGNAFTGFYLDGDLASHSVKGTLSGSSLGLTNFGVEITVTDTQTGLSKNFSSFPGAPFQPIQDTFSSCPPAPASAGGAAGH